MTHHELGVQKSGRWGAFTGFKKFSGWWLGGGVSWVGFSDGWVMVRKVIIVSVHVCYFSFFQFMSVRLHQVT